MKRNRLIETWIWPALVVFSLTSALPVLAGEAANEVEAIDEREDPALRTPLPEFAAPAADDEQAPIFSTEAPPPPPFDPGYQSPRPAPDEEDEL